MKHEPQLAIEHAPPRWGFALPLLAVLGTFLLVAGSPERITPDSALYLQCAQLLLEGQRPYVDFVEVNPPFVFYFHVPPVLISRALGAPVVLVFSILVAAVSAWSTFSIYRLLRRHMEWRGVAAGGAATWGLFSFFMHSSDSFGQREHLLALLYVPYLVACSLKAQEPPNGPAPGTRSPLERFGPIIRGLAAGCGLCLKPQFVVVGLALEIYWLLWNGRRRPRFDAEILAAVSVPVLYALHFVLLPAEIRDSFFQRWLPLIAARYVVYDVPIDRLFHGPTTISLGLGLLALCSSPWLPNRAGTLIGALGFFVASAVGIYFLQQKGWSYHQLPIVAASAMLSAILADRFLRGLFYLWAGSERSRLVFLARTIAVPLLVGASWLLRSHTYPLPIVEPRQVVTEMEAVVSTHTRTGEPVLVVCSSVPSSYPLLLRTDRRPGSRYPWCFPIAMVARGGAAGSAETPAQRRSMGDEAWLRTQEDQFLADLRADLRSRKPPVVFISTIFHTQGCRPDFQILEYLASVEILSELERSHERIADVSDFAVFVAKARLRT